jgi:DNA-binding NtrC family response regulator
MPHVLLVEDERSIRDVLATLLAEHGHDVTVAESGEQGLELAARARPDVAVLDLMLPGMSGVDVLTRLKQMFPDVGCILMTAYGSIRSAVEAIRAGGDDYLTKPFDNDELLLAIDRVLQIRRLTREVEALRTELNTRYGFTEIIGVCPAMQEVFRLMARVSGVDTTVLILGESGTGKELVARGIHRRSRRADGPFVAVNCSAIPSTLIEAEFFGYERGAFTDAKEGHPGWFEQANHGTLFLDEVADLPPDAQAKLLRRPTGQPGHPDRRAAADQSRRPAARRDQQGSGSGRRVRPVPAGPVLAAQRRGPPVAAAASARRGSSAPPRRPRRTDRRRAGAWRRFAVT